MPYADKEQRRAFHREYMRERRKALSQKLYDKETNRKYKHANKERYKANQYAWRKENPEVWKQIKRRAERRRETGKKCVYSGVSLVNTVIESIYYFRDVCSSITGEPHHVDHIMPLSHGGQHVPWNLQVLTAVENLRKSSKIV